MERARDGLLLSSMEPKASEQMLAHYLEAVIQEINVMRYMEEQTESLDA